LWAAYSLSMIALVKSEVVEFPPRSPVLQAPVSNEWL